MQYTIQPYLCDFGTVVVAGETMDLHQVWVFDDPQFDLEMEALISGTDEVLNYAVQRFDLQPGFSLTFSDEPLAFTDLIGTWYQAGVDELTGYQEGNWYEWHEPGRDQPGLKGWLCNALLLYFQKPPKTLYIQVSSAR